MKELELTLEVFKKRTPQEKQQFIMELAKQNLKQVKNIKLMLKEIKELKLIIEDIQYDIELINKKV